MNVIYDRDNEAIYAVYDKGDRSFSLHGRLVAQRLLTSSRITASPNGTACRSKSSRWCQFGHNRAPMTLLAHLYKVLYGNGMGNMEQ